MVVAESRHVAEDAAESRRGRLRAVAGRVRLSRRDRSVRAARACGSPIEHRRAYSLQSRRQRRGVRERRACLQGVAAHASRRAVLHGVPRARRGIRPRYRRVHGLYLVPGRAPHEAHADGCARSQRQSAPRDLARCRRRLRPQGRALSGISVRRGRRAKARPSGKVDRGPPRELPRHTSGARRILGHRDRGRREREDPGASRSHGPRRGRVSAVGFDRAVDRRDDRAGPLRHPELQARRACGVHRTRSPPPPCVARAGPRAFS